jgi:hypothetical protein
MEPDVGIGDPTKKEVGFSRQCGSDAEAIWGSSLVCARSTIWGVRG